MISHHLWQQRYGLDPAVAGRTMSLNGAPSTIVGVLPASFDFGTLFAPGRQVDVFGRRSHSTTDQPHRQLARRGRAPAART